MRKIVGLAVSVVLAAGVAALAFGQSPAGGKRGGEQEQILARERWFGERRGLDRVPRADLRRRAAVEETRAARDRVAVRLAGSDWQPLGPDSMTMLDWDMGAVAGRVAAFAVQPGDEAVLYLGAA